MGCVLGALVLGLGASGCARLVVESDPPGAEVVWSQNGSAPWRPWPPRVWDDKRALGDDPTTATTPLAEIGPYGDYVFISVRKPGYRPPPPKLAGLYLFATTELKFSLDETPEHFSERMRAQGLVPWRGGWVRPERYDLVDAGDGEWVSREEKFRRDQAARGLVEFEGKWLSRDDAKAAFVARQTERGMVELKGRWIAKDRAEREVAIDRAVEDLGTFATSELVPPKVLGAQGSAAGVVGAGDVGGGAGAMRAGGAGLAGLGLRNTAGFPTRWLLSGPSSVCFDLPVNGELKPGDVPLIPGRYRIVVVGLEEGSGHRAGPAESSDVDREYRGPAEDLLPGGYREALVAARAAAAAAEKSQNAGATSAEDLAERTTVRSATVAAAAQRAWPSGLPVALLDSQPLTKSFFYVLTYSGVESKGGGR